MPEVGSLGSPISQSLKGRKSPEVINCNHTLGLYFHVTDAVQTDGCLVPKADCEVQTSGNDDELLLQLESSEHEVNLLKSSIHRICLDNAALGSMYKERRGQLTKASEICHALEDQMKRLAEELKATKTDKEALQVNKHLKAEVSKLQEKVCSLTNEIAETRDSEALKLEGIERLYREAKEENQFMRRAVTAASAGVTPGHQASTAVQQGSRPVPAAPQDVPKCMPTQKTPVKASPCKGKHPGSASAVPASSKKSKLENKGDSS
ncbi:uncharacterized protein LOC144114954 [Amblyomma americanum]